MANTRQEKVARLIQKELSQVFLAKSSTLFHKAMITVTNVRMSPDMGIAKCYLSLYLTPDQKKLLEEIKAHTHEIRKDLSARIGRQIRAVPELVFFHDDSLDYLENIERLLK